MKPSSWHDLRRILRDNNTEALERFEKSLEKRKIHPQVRSAIAAQLKWIRGETDTALSQLEQVAEKRDLGPHELMIRGLIQLDRAESLETALADLKQAAKAQLGDPRVQCGLAGVAMQRGDFEPAQRLVQKALKLDPKHWHGRYLLGLIEKQLGQADKAIASFHAVTKQAPDHEDAWLNHAAILLERGDNPNAAVHVLAPGARGHPERKRVNLALIDCLQQAGKIDEAIEALGELAREHDDPDLVMELLEMLLGANRKEAAKSVLQALEQMAPEGPRICYLRGVVAGADGPSGFEAAAAHHEDALQIDPNYWPSLNALGTIRAQEKNAPEAERLFIQAAQSPEQPEQPLLNLAILYGSQGNFDRAQQILTDIVQSEQMNPETRARAQHLLKHLPQQK